MCYPQAAMDDASLARLTAAIREVVDARAMPAPRGLPYLGLEHPSGTSLDLLHTLSTRGIFRKYELVLNLEAGLGGAAGWLVQRLGCEVVGTATAAEAAAAMDLVRRARLGGAVRFVAAASPALPFAAGRFTHVWIVDSLPRLPEPERALAEAARVLRHGGILAVQDLVRGPGGAPPDLAGWTFATAEARAAALADAGFVDVHVTDRSAEAGEHAAAVLAARERLLALLDRHAPALAAERRALAAALATGALRVAHLVARAR